MHAWETANTSCVVIVSSSYYRILGKFASSQRSHSEQFVISEQINPISCYRELLQLQVRMPKTTYWWKFLKVMWWHFSGALDSVHRTLLKLT